jgi:hypothetical protein
MPARWYVPIVSLAGASAVAAAVSLLVSGAALAMFFSTQIDRWGRLNDATTALFGLLMILPAIEVAGRTTSGPPPFAIGAAAVGIAGMTVIVITSGLTAAAKLDWLVSAKIGLAGFVGLLVWMTVVSVQAIRHGGFPRAFGWWGLATISFAVAAAVAAIRFIRAHGTLAGEVAFPVTLSGLFGLVCVGFLTWTAWLGISL